MEILFEDSFILAAAKPSGMVVHRGFASDKVTLADLVREHVGAPVHAIHRLDRGTSGVVLFARDAVTAKFLQEQIQARGVQKRYIALVRGPMRFDGLLDHAIRDRETNERVPASTILRPLAHAGRWSLVEALPLTGRTHQIRLHLKHLSNPIIGDVRYGKGDVNRFFRETYNLRRLALHAASLQLMHPMSGQLTIESKIPSDLADTLKALNLLPSDLY